MAENYKSSFSSKYKRVTTLRSSCSLFSIKSKLLENAIPNKSDVLFIYDKPSSSKKSQVTQYLDMLKHQQSISSFSVAMITQPDEVDSRSDFDNVIKIIKKVRLKRKDIVIVLGEKETIDLVNFTASMYRRGLQCIRIYLSETVAMKAMRQGNCTSVRVLGPQGECLSIWSNNNYSTNHVFACHESIVQPPDHKGTVLLENRNNGGSEFDIYYKYNLLKSEAKELVSLVKNRESVVIIFDPYRGFKINQLKYFFNKQVSEGSISDYQLIPLRVTEHNKSIETSLALIETLNLLNINKDDLIVVFGGGAIMDVVGYAASLFNKFGLDYIRVPTTLVGMIDAGIGLKVGVNYGGSKNFIGDYYPPLACFVDISFLDSLPREEISCGLSEAIKIAAVKDKSLYDHIVRYFHH